MESRSATVDAYDTTEQPINDQLVAYALGILDADERTTVERYLAQNPAARQEVAVLRQVVSAFPYEPDLPPLPEGHAERFAQKLAALTGSDAAPLAPAPAPTAEQRPLAFPTPAERAEREARRPPTRSVWAGWAVAAVLAALALASTLWGAGLNNELAAARQTQTQQATQIRDLQTAQAQWEQERATAIRVLGAPDVVARPLTATAGLPGVVSNLWVSAATNEGVLITHNLPATDAGYLYEFWLIGEVPVAAGVFQSSGDGMSWLVVRAPQQLSAFKVAAITVEPIPGGATPTTQPILVGNL